ncbi:alpha/beta-hydrolase [Ceraceosorus guamensis]|uniref:Alpha/beta-hydrolase n=1 Tax=Ceraceosorus guamensis TaxID=1522189 RepID=A0A316W7U5_9BASI|nr:alpha/beta-hydrolase [Ceraceosorus guamensis]PWN45990.1 alpha/beta-hydrolase [Ceraceosorus guamensis]
MAGSSANISSKNYWMAYIGQRAALSLVGPPKSFYLGKQREHRVLPIPTRHGDVQCWVYDAAPGTKLNTHTDQSRGTGAPIHVSIHGGGCILSSPWEDDHINSHLAGLGMVVVSPVYSCAPQKRFPVAEEEVYDVCKWLSTKSREAHGWDSSRISVSGFSAGGKLALNIAQQAHAESNETLRLRALAPYFTMFDVTRSKRRSKHSNIFPVVPAWQLALVQAVYFPDIASRSTPLASPYHDPALAEACRGIPLLITTGGRDTLGVEGDEVARRLGDAGVDVTHKCFEAADHAYTHKGSKETARESIMMLGDFLTKHLSLES